MKCLKIDLMVLLRENKQTFQISDAAIPGGIFLFHVRL
jgi:hypothetical protein